MIALKELKKARRVLFLQGPMGNFFTRFSGYLQAKGIICYKINFNGGDRFFYPSSTETSIVTDYTGKQSDYKVWLNQYITENKIDSIVCFGDCRFYHRKAKAVAQALGVRFFVFEEGYIRPDYITFEADGVNDHSETKFDHIKADYSAKNIEVNPTHSKYWLLVLSTVAYFVMSWVYFWKFTHYKHHRQLSNRQEVRALFVSVFRRVTRYIPEKLASNKIFKQYSGQYFIAALQVHNDSQVHFHSDFEDVKSFILQVITSFAAQAPSELLLVIKHHPMDRGYRYYGGYINEVAKRFSLENRVIYVCDVHLPTLIKNSLGLVTINSTTGLQSLYHGKPVKVLGRAIYNLPKLVAQCDLDDYWRSPGRVNLPYFYAFRRQLIEKTQLNGSFYGVCSWMEKDIFIVPQQLESNEVTDRQELSKVLYLVGKGSDAMTTKNKVKVI